MGGVGMGKNMERYKECFIVQKLASQLSKASPKK
jgi:hypothetical protein